MEKILREKHTVVFSKEIEVELHKRFKAEQIDELALKELIRENLLMYVEANPLQLKEAKTLSAEINVPFLDVVHAIIARDVSAMLVTRDKHFEELRHIVEVKLPEEITSHIRDKAP